MAISTYNRTKFFYTSEQLTHFYANETNTSILMWLWVSVSSYAWPADTNQRSLYVHMCPLACIGSFSLGQTNYFNRSSQESFS